MSLPAFALVHSPLVGPGTWRRVADVLRERGHPVSVPELRDEPAAWPYWRRHAASAAAAIREAGLDRPVVLAGHSGAGPLLPAIAAAMAEPVAAYLFVDAGLPADGRTRLESLRGEDAALADRLERELRAGGTYPAWDEARLAPLVPDPAARTLLVAELRPRGLDFFTEPVPAPAGWEAVPAGYLQLSRAYDVPAEQARRAGWPVRAIEAGHFHLLVEPARVADGLVELARALGVV